MTCFRKFALLGALVGTLVAVGAGPAAAGEVTPPSATGKIIIDKVTDPAHHPEAFAFTVTGQPGFSLTDDSPPKGLTLAPGSYDVTEGAPPAWYWALESLTCIVTKPGGGTTYSPNLAQRKVSITLGAGGEIKCTFKNQKRGKVIVKKLTDQSSSDTFPFTLAGGPDAVSLAFGLQGGGTYTSPLLKAGSGYSVSESLANLPDWENYFAECKKGSTDLEPGELHDRAARRDHLHVQEPQEAEADRDQARGQRQRRQRDGRAVHDAGHRRQPSQSSFPGSEAGTVVYLKPGAYAVDETGVPAGYAKSIGAGCSGTIANGDSKSCTITNDDIPAKLTVIKKVTNEHGGTAASGDFTMSINGVTASGGNSFPGSAAGVTKTLTTVGAYDVTESGPGGYEGTFSADCTGTIALGAGEDVHGREQRRAGDSHADQGGRERQRRHGGAGRLWSLDRR